MSITFLASISAIRYFLRPKMSWMKGTLAFDKCPEISHHQLPQCLLRSRILDVTQRSFRDIQETAAKETTAPVMPFNTNTHSRYIYLGSHEEDELQMSVRWCLRNAVCSPKTLICLCPLEGQS